MRGSGVLSRVALYRLVGLSGLILAGACSGDDGEESANRVYDTQIEAPTIGGHSGPRYEVPIPVTDGDLWPADFNFQEAGDRATAVELSEGTPLSGKVAGIEIIPIAAANRENAAGLCDIAEFKEAKHFEFGYLPPGTSLQTPQYEALCPDGSLNFVSQEFVTKHGGFLKVEYGHRAPGHRFFVYDAPEERVRTTEINGREALVVDPPIPEGMGQSLVAHSAPNGFITVIGANIPVEEIIRLLENLKCADC